MAHLLRKFRKTYQKMLRRYHRTFFIFFGIIAFCLGACSGSRAVYTPPTEADIRKIIDSSSWVFTVNQVIPVFGRARDPNGIYTVMYDGQKLVVHLPYFGRATAGVDVYTGRGPLDFSATSPAFDKREVKPGEWEIQLRPDNREVQAMDFTFLANGKAYLAIRLTSRSAINYNGSIRPLSKEERK